MKAKLYNITPEMAANWLKKNTQNRPLDNRRVRQMVDLIIAGKWVPNGETIKFAGNRLIDGQHRLTAIMMAGIACASLVLFDLSEDAFATLGNVKPRTGTDFFALRGYANPERLAPAIHYVLFWERGFQKDQNRLDDSIREDVVKRHPGLMRSAEICSGLNLKGLIVPGIAVAAHYIFSTKDSDLADTFLMNVVTGIGLTEANPEYLLRQRLIQNRGSRSKIEKHYVFKLTVVAWNAVRSGGNLKVLRYVDGKELEVI